MTRSGGPDRDAPTRTVSGRILVIGLLVTAVLAGAAMYWLQVFAFYRTVAASEIAVETASGRVVVPVTAFDGIDADSSPIRYRACLELAAPLPADALPAVDADPLTAPSWFRCYDARAIGDALRSGAARAVLSQRDVTYGIDRILAVYPDGRAVAWHQINACGTEVFDGNPPPPGCPPVPQPSNAADRPAD